MRPVDPRLLRQAWVAYGWLAGSVTIGLGTATLVVAQGFLLARAIADATLAPIPLLGLVFAGRAGLSWAAEVVGRRASSAVKSRLRRRVLERLAARGRVEHRAELTALLGRGLDGLDEYFGGFVPQLVLASIVPVAIVVVLALVDPLAAVTVAVTVPLAVVLLALVGRTAGERARRRWRALEVLAHHFADVVGGLVTLKVFGRAKAQIASVQRVSERSRRETLGALRLAFLSAFVLELYATLAVALVAVGVGVRLVEGSGSTLRTALVALILAPEAYLPIRAVGARFHAGADGVAAVSSVLELLDEPLPARGSRIIAPAGRVLGPVAGSGAGSRAGASPGPTIRVERLTVRFADRAGAGVTGLSFVVRSGEIVALSGPSGIGKSTALEVLLGLREPNAGRVLVDEVELGALDPASWRRAVSWMPQRPYLFDGTIADNVRLGRPAASLDDVRSALDAAAAGELAPDRTVREHGEGLSIGEQRRVALARALIRSTPVLLLDEPTAGLDADAEAYVLKALCGLRDRGRTILVVAHRPAALEVADRVVRAS